MPSPSRSSLRPFAPQRFGRYTLLTPIATGGMGAVFLARLNGVEGFEKFVVIKKILPQYASSEEFVARFVDEARLLVKLQHGSVAQVMEVGVEDGEHFIAMEFVDGKDLRKLLARARDLKETVPVGLALYVMVRVLDALAYAHRKKDEEDRELGLVHRDVSPQNVLISYEGEVKVIDFGLAKSALSLGRTSPSMVLGKFCYMSPEQARHQKLDRRSDLYAVGICLWELLVGKNPFDDVHPGELMSAVANPNLPSLAELRRDLPVEVTDAVMKALAVDREARFATAEEMRGRLTAAMLEVDPLAGPESLAGWMRDRFSAEYESERKAMAGLTKVRGEEGAARTMTPVPAPPPEEQTGPHPVHRDTEPPVPAPHTTPVDLPAVVIDAALETEAPAASATPVETPAAPPRSEVVDTAPLPVPPASRPVPLWVWSVAGAAFVLVLAIGYLAVEYQPAPAHVVVDAPLGPEPIPAPAPAPTPPPAPAPVVAAPTPVPKHEEPAPMPLEPAPAKPRRLSASEKTRRVRLDQLYRQAMADLGKLEGISTCSHLGPVCTEVKPAVTKQFESGIDAPERYDALERSLVAFSRSVDRARHEHGNR